MTIGLPNPSLASRLRYEADARLLNSLRYLVEETERQVRKVSSRPRATELIDHALKSLVDSSMRPRLSSGLYSLHSQLRWALEENHQHRATALLHALPTLAVWVEGEPLLGDFPDLGSVNGALAFATFARESKRAYGSSFDGLPSSHLGRSLTALRRVQATLATFDAPSAEEYSAITSEVWVIDSEQVNAGTSFRAFGCILVRTLHPEREWTTYLENIVHEAAHLYLYLLSLDDPLLLDDGDATYRSPLRTEPRPLSGIFHAMFVLARTIRAIRNLREIDELRADIDAMSTSYNYAKNPASFEEKFLETQATILQHGSLTLRGQELLADCMQMVGV